MEILIQAAQLILSLSILVTLHEFGHYIPARIFKTRVEKFYLFFNYKFSLYKKQIGETEWGIGWIPFGGYVKIAGMVDESMDTEQLAKPAEPWEFRAKPAWQRLIIMIGGVTVNLILGIFIYICLIWGYGESRLAPKDVNDGLAVAPMLHTYGIKTGDVVLAADGEKLVHATDINKMIMLRGARTLLIQHPDQTTETVVLPNDIEYKLFKSGVIEPFSFRHKSNLIDSIPKGSASKGILQKGDKIVTIGGQKIDYFDNSIAVAYASRGKKTEVVFVRENDTLKKFIQVDKEGKLGLMYAVGTLVQDTTKVQDITYSFGQSISRGTSYGMHILKDYGAQLKFLFTAKGATSVGGFATIGKLFSPTWDWRNFWEKTAFISIILAFMNILPIPALDGGHVVFLLYEMVTGREAPQKILEYAQYVGIFLLLGLMIYANGADLIRSLMN